VALLFVLASSNQAVFAQGRAISIIRDAETESLIKRFAEPLMKAAGLQRTTPRIYIVNDRRFNAFVIEDGSIFINYGTIIESETPNALKAVLAHEIGHLAGGHIARIREQAEISGRMQIFAMLLGVGAAAAAAGSGASGEVSEMASAFILATQSVGQNTLAAFRRSEESTADAAGLRYLQATGESGKGLVDVLETLAADQVRRAGANDYLRTHPLAEDRLDQVRKTARANANWNRGSSAADTKALELVKAKLVGFLESQEVVLNRYPNADKSQAARYARLITAYKSGAAVAAVAQMPRLVAESPSNPYFQELLGQMYFETGNATQALGPLKKAVSMAPEQTEIRVLYGQALIDAGGAENLTEAAAQLNRVTREDPTSLRGFVLLSRAYAGLGQQGEASLAAAEAALVRGDKGTALGLARQAQQNLNPSSPAWLRADDILSLG